MVTDDTVTPVRDHLLEAATGGPPSSLTTGGTPNSAGRLSAAPTHCLRAIARANSP
jgi:hypothetical protein